MNHNVYIHTIPMVVVEGGPLPKQLMADIDMSISPSPTLSEHGSGVMEGTVQTPCIQDDAEMVRESQRSPELESV